MELVTYLITFSTSSYTLFLRVYGTHLYHLSTYHPSIHLSTRYAFSISPMHGAHPTHLIFRDLTMVITFGEGHTL
jgi:hypothetical protein